MCVLNSTCLQQHARRTNTTLSFVRFQKRQEDSRKGADGYRRQENEVWKGLSIVHTSVVQMCFI
jgi:stalled ribosome alternative rescue factor ArfA